MWALVLPFRSFRAFHFAQCFFRMEIATIYAIISGGVVLCLIVLYFRGYLKQLLRTISLQGARYLVYPQLVRRHRYIGPWSLGNLGLHLLYFTIIAICVRFRASSFQKSWPPCSKSLIDSHDSACIRLRSQLSCGYTLASARHISAPSSINCTHIPLTSAVSCARHNCTSHAFSVECIEELMGLLRVLVPIRQERMLILHRERCP
jgi:hypothetical protein